MRSQCRRLRRHPLTSGLLGLVVLVGVLLACNGSGADPAAFTFNTDSQGFTFDGIYDGGQNVQVAACSNPDTTFQSLPYHSPSVNYFPPANDSQSGSLLVFMSVPNCFPADTAAASTGFVRYGLLSPSLEANSNWQDIDAFSFRVQVNIPGLQAQPLAHVTRPDGSETIFRPVNSGGSPVFTPIPDDGQWHEVRFDLPEEDVTVRQVEARFFIEVSAAHPLYPANEASLNLDYVQPITAP